MARVTPRPASRCPRCQFAFGSPDLMLDHLSAAHLTRTSSDTRVVIREDAGAPIAHAALPDVASHAPRAPEADAVLADLETAYRRSSRRRPHRPGRSALVAILTLLLVAWIVVILT